MKTSRVKEYQTDHSSISYPLKTPVFSKWDAKVQTEAQQIVKQLIIKHHGPFDIHQTKETS